MITGILRAWNPYHGWIPIVIHNIPQDLADTISQKYIAQPVSEIEKLVNDGQDPLVIYFSKNAESNLMQFLGIDLPPSLHISKVSLVGILEAIRDVILRWSLKLEEDGILGEGITFSVKEKQIVQAAPAHYSIRNYTKYINMSQTYSSNSDNYSTNIQAGRDVSGITSSSNVSGVVAGGHISGNVTNTYSKSTDANINEILKLTEYLSQRLERASPICF
ncbi:hypothetical protein NUACC21_38200 [Scytonema sp. NUACC21]